MVKYTTHNGRDIGSIPIGDKKTSSSRGRTSLFHSENVGSIPTEVKKNQDSLSSRTLDFDSKKRGAAPLPGKDGWWLSG